MLPSDDREDLIRRAEMDAYHAQLRAHVRIGGPDPYWQEQADRFRRQARFLRDLVDDDATRSGPGALGGTDSPGPR